MNYQRKILNQTLVIFIVVNLLFIGLLFLKHLIGKDLVITMGAGVFIITTIVVSKIQRLDAFSIGVQTDSIYKDFQIIMISTLLIFPLFLLVNHFYQIFFLKHHFYLSFRDNILTNIVNNLLIVALPEEIFFRGYLQGRFQMVYESRRLFGPLSIANFITSVLFALGHFFISPRFERLAVFFPSLLFGYLRERRGNIYPSVVIHWLSNVIMYIVLGMYR